MALLWALQRKFVNSVMIGVSNLNELEECMEAVKGEHWLSVDQVYANFELNSIKHYNLSQDKVKVKHRVMIRKKNLRYGLYFRV